MVEGLTPFERAGRIAELIKNAETPMDGVNKAVSGFIEKHPDVDLDTLVLGLDEEGGVTTDVREISGLSFIPKDSSVEIDGQRVPAEQVALGRLSDFRYEAK